MNMQHVSSKTESGNSLLRIGFMVALCLSFFLEPLGAMAQENGRRGREWGGGEREFDLNRYIKRADRDGNGMLSENELGGRLRGMVQELGVDTSRPVSVATVTKAIERKAKTKADAEHAKEIDGNRKVSKFGTDVEYPAPAGFGVSDSGAAAGRLEDNYDSKMVDTVRRYMGRFDENKDGWLDENESRRVRRMLGENADSDGNGKLGEMEVAAALQSRMQNGNEDQGRRGRRGGRGDREAERGERGSENKRSFTGRSRPSTPTTKPASTPATPKKASRPMSDRQRAYVDGLFKRYDSDKNGTLSAEERKKISGSVKLVDVDGDGVVARQEALDSVAGNVSIRPESAIDPSERGPRSRKRRSGSESSSSDEGNDESASDSESGMKYDITGFGKVPIEHQARGGVITDLQNQGANDEFLDYDNDVDGQISMSEFRNDAPWTDQLVGKFQTLDSNDDGVVTIDEFNANSGQLDELPGKASSDEESDEETAGDEEETGGSKVIRRESSRSSSKGSSKRNSPRRRPKRRPRDDQ